MINDFNMQKVINISHELSFLQEFLTLCLDNVIEFINTCSDVILQRNIETYGKMIHKIKTTFLILNLDNFYTLLSDGKDVLKHENYTKLSNFHDIIIENLTLLKIRIETETDILKNTP